MDTGDRPLTFEVSVDYIPDFRLFFLSVNVSVPFIVTITHLTNTY